MENQLITKTREALRQAVDKQISKLEKARNLAISKNQETFIYNKQEVTVEYAKYIIEHLKSNTCL